jgi:hypothetical protein
MEIATMCLRGLGAGHWARLRRNGVAEPVMLGLVKNIGGMRWPDGPKNGPPVQLATLTQFLFNRSRFLSRLD